MTTRMRPEFPAEEFIAQAMEEFLWNRMIYVKDDLMIGFGRSCFHRQKVENGIISSIMGPT